MINRRQTLQLLLTLGSPFVLGKALWSAPNPTKRVISLGGTITEIIYALGQEQHLIANDISSLYPPEATRLPRVGYYRSLSLEGLLSLQPRLVLASEHAGPHSVLKRLRDLGVDVITVSDQPNFPSFYERITQLGDALNSPDQAQHLQQQVQAQIDAVQHQYRHQTPTFQHAAVIMQRTQQLHVAGKETVADLFLNKVGLNNIAATHQGYKPVSTEHLIALAPDVIIITQSSLDNSGHIDAFLTQHQLSLTPAGQHKRVIVVDDLLLLGIGPRFGDALQHIYESLHQFS